MFQGSLEFDFLARKERCKDLIREAEHEHLIQVARQQPGNWESHQKIANWLGAQVLKWGSKRQR